jgi:GR25 family glycosyltransferase involved in LPS biosynthesis
MLIRSAGRAPMIKMIQLFGSVCLLFHSTILANDEDCKWSKHVGAPETYYINLDRSKDRRANMERHLDNVGMSHFRVRGISPKEIYIPEDIENTWRTAQCKMKTDWVPPAKKSIDYTSAYVHHSSFMTALCGRGKKKNTPKELGCTTSHLMAMRNAIYSNSPNRYALIVEDDVQFPFDVDWNELAKSAPEDFSILQLFNSNEATMTQTWNAYTKNSSDLWTLRGSKKYFDFWSTCAYLVDKVKMKSVIDAVIFEVNGWTSFNVIAGMNMNPSCVPAACCANGTDYENFIKTPPCVWAPRGYQAGSTPLDIIYYI